jgi:hypothetical protein
VLFVAAVVQVAGSGSFPSRKGGYLMSPDKSAAQDDEQKLSSRFPSAYTILFGLIILVSTLTWIIPAGKYDRAWPAHSYPPSGPNNAGVAHRILCGSLRFSIHSLGLQVAQVERCFSDLI